MSLAKFADELGKFMVVTPEKSTRKRAEKTEVYIGNTQVYRVVAKQGEHQGTITVKKTTHHIFEVYLTKSELFVWCDEEFISYLYHDQYIRLD